jgi:hypothetical protein
VKDQKFRPQKQVTRKDKFLEKKYLLDQYTIPTIAKDSKAVKKRSEKMETPKHLKKTATNQSYKASF